MRLRFVDFRVFQAFLWVQGGLLFTFERTP
jgi:hypothetical protein